MLRQSLLFVGMALMVNDPLAGQTPSPATDAPCAYEACALRLDWGGGGIRIVQGSDHVVSRIGIFRRDDLTRLVGESADATAEARVFERNYSSGTLLIVAGLAAAVAGTLASNIDASSGASATLAIGGLAMAGYGGFRHHRGLAALSRSLWLFNRKFSR